MNKSMLFFCITLLVILFTGWMLNPRPALMNLHNNSGTPWLLNINGDIMKLPTDPGVLNEVDQHNVYQETADVHAQDFPLQEIENNILKEVARSPKAALDLLADSIEKEAMKTLASTGRMKNRLHVPLKQSIMELDDHYGLPGFISGSVNLFLKTKDSKSPVTNPTDILVAIEVGINILRSIKAVPRQITWVIDPDIELYSDPEAKEKMQDVKGVLLKSMSTTRTFYHLFPSTKTHFIKGHRVAWEWESENAWEKVWYKDPDTGEIKIAWTSATEFVGQDLERFY